MDLLQIERALIENKAEIDTANNDYDRLMICLRNERKELTRLKRLSMNGVDMEKSLLAEKCLFLSGDLNRFDENVIQRAINDISTGEDKLRNEYFGIKDYQHFRGQQSDHNYNYGPTHGHIVFRVGLRPNVRQDGLTDIDRNACLYYLNLLLDKQEFKNNAKFD